VLLNQLKLESYALASLTRWPFSLLLNFPNLGTAPCPPKHSILPESMAERLN
jgi:hypothetical protein